MNSKAERLVQSMTKLSTLPTVYIKINKLVNDPDSRASQVAEVIASDQSITAQILRLVNSAMFGLPGRVDNVGRAVTTVGFKQTRDLVLATSVMDKFSSSNEFVDMESFWKHGLGTAMFARSLALQCREVNAEAFFTAGLLHDLGRLVIFENRKGLALEELAKNMSSGNQLLYKLEKQVLGFTHSDVAEVLLHNWNLPQMIQEAVTYHHHPRSATQFKKATAIIHIADILAHALELGNSADKYIPEINEKAWQELALPISSITVVADEVLSHFEETVSIFIKGE